MSRQVGNCVCGKRVELRTTPTTKGTSMEFGVLERKKFAPKGECPECNRALSMTSVTLSERVA